MPSADFFELTRAFLSGAVDRDEYESRLIGISRRDDREHRKCKDDERGSLQTTGRVIGESTNDDTVEMLLDEFGGHEITGGTEHPDKIAGITQKERLINFLSDGRWHNTLEIAARVYGVAHPGICRIAARIYDLKSEGYAIESEKQKGSIWKYRWNHH